MRDLRKFARQTQNRIVIGLVFLVATVGIFLIYIFYGQGAALFGLLCLVGLVLIIFLIIGFLYLLEKLAKND